MYLIPDSYFYDTLGRKIGKNYAMYMLILMIDTTPTSVQKEIVSLAELKDLKQGERVSLTLSNGNKIRVPAPLKLANSHIISHLWGIIFWQGTLTSQTNKI